MDQRYIAAIEIGSSKIKGAVASVDPDTAQVNVLAVAQEPLINSVRYGRVQNVQDVSSAVNDIIRKLENSREVTPRKIRHVFISLGGRSFTTLSAVGELKLPGEYEITQETIQRLKRDALDDISTAKKVVSVEPRKFFVANQEVKNPIGTFGQNIRGEFTAIVCSPENIINLDRIKLDNTEGDITRSYITRIVALADMVTTDSERQLGCALFDVGAETTTVAIYKNGALRYIATLPLGGRNITLDLTQALSITEDSAESLKCKRASATPRRSGTVDATQTTIDNYVPARAGEIIANALNQLKVAGLKGTDLPAGIIVTGGAAKLDGFTTLLEQQSKMNVRQADIDSTIVLDTYRLRPADNIDIIALLRYAAYTTDDNCLSEIIKPDRISEQQHVRDVAEDDDDLLRDDPDGDEGDDDNKDGDRGSIWSKFSFGRGKSKDKAKATKKKPEPEPDDDDDYDEPEPDDYGNDDDDDKPQPQNKIFQKIGKFGTKIFGDDYQDDLK